MPIIESLIGAIPAIAGMGIGLLNERHQDKRQQQQQQALTQIQENANNRLADRQAERNYEYWKQTGVAG